MMKVKRYSDTVPRSLAAKRLDLMACFPSEFIYSFFLSCLQAGQIATEI